MKGNKIRLQTCPHTDVYKKRKLDSSRSTRCMWLNQPQWFDVQSEYSPSPTNYIQQQYPPQYGVVSNNHPQYNTAVAGAAVNVPTYEAVPSQRYAVPSSKSSHSFAGHTKPKTTKAAQQPDAPQLQHQLKMMTSNLPPYIQHQIQQYLQEQQREMRQEQQTPMHQQQQRPIPQQKSLNPRATPSSLHQQYNQQKLLQPNIPTPPTYAEQMQTAYQAYLLEQRRFNQQQNQLLEQLYQNCPQIPTVLPMESTRMPHETCNNTPGSRSGLQSQSSFQPQQQHQHQHQQQHQQQQQQQQRNPFYTAQQHCRLMQQQHNNVLRDQHNIMHQHYDPSRPAKTFQLYGMAVPECSVLPSSAFMQY